MRRRTHKVRRSAFSLVELLVVVGIVVLLAAMLVPSFSAARRAARIAACKGQMHSIHPATAAYAASNSRRLPPFAMESHRGSVPLAGHYGGSPPGDPNGTFRRGVAWVNLSALSPEGYLQPDALRCPDAHPDLQSGQASWFAHSDRYSTYCLRFSASEDLFADAEPLAGYAGGSLLNIYNQAAGGQRVQVGMHAYRVPQVRIDRRYRLLGADPPGDGWWDLAGDVLLADAFWQADEQIDQAGAPFDVRRSRCHGDRYNVLRGDGSVATAEGGSVIDANTPPPGGALADDGENLSTYAERIWQHFDGAD